MDLLVNLVFARLAVKPCKHKDFPGKQLITRYPYCKFIPKIFFFFEQCKNIASYGTSKTYDYMSRQVSCQYGKSNIIVIGQKIKEQCHTAAAGCGQLAKPVNITFVNINLRNSGDTYWSKQTTAMELKISEPSRLHTSHNQSRESSQCNGLRSKGGGERGREGGKGV